MKFCTPIIFIITMSLFVPIAFGQIGRINTPNAKLRQCDDLRCRVLIELNEGDSCIILGKGKTELLDSYGVHAWLKIKVDHKTGYVFGGLLDVLNDNSRDIPFENSGYIRPENVNVRACAGLQNCDVIFRLKKGDYCRIISKSKMETTIKGLGTHPWYFIEVDKKTGYVFGGLVDLEPKTISIVENAPIYDYPDTLQGQILNTALKGDSFEIKSQSRNSQVIRPYGRYYWYELLDGGKANGWIFGAFTSKRLEAPVDCQCVDYVKNMLSINGPTKNAFEWDQVLLGEIPVIINDRKVFLDYLEITDSHDIKKGDIAMFHRSHLEANPDYGHIGIVHKMFNQDAQIPIKIGIEGANHALPLEAFYSKKRCNNVSLKKYALNEYVRFFRLVESNNSK